VDEPRDEAPEDSDLDSPELGDVDESPAERMERLREITRQDRQFGYLIDGFPDSTPRRSRKPWFVAGGALAGVAMMAGAGFAMFGGGGGDAAPPASGDGSPAATPTNIAVLAQPTSASQKPSPTATPVSVPMGQEIAPGEGAVARNATGQAPAGYGQIFGIPIPVKAKVVDRFGSSRGGDMVHAGIDVIPAASSGAIVVVSVCSGNVAGIDRLDGYGDFVAIDCGNGWRAIFAQLKDIKVKAGQPASAGQPLAGTAKDYLHFELRYNGVPVDPEAYIDFSVDPAATPTPGPTNTPAAAPTSVANLPPDTPQGGQTPTVQPPAAPTSTPTPAPPTATPTKTPKPPTRTPTPKPVSQ
jgi:lipoprotein NlpD